ncbi:hypothetical protein ACNSOS_04480 [Aliarcobacter vitoriensis]|uniref:hypothetical protein n=1 Tax=Aliarcobacter vitoriensis TaxID=2011099 RepID=UPI003AACDFD3
MNSLELAKKRAKIEKSRSNRSKLDEHIKAIEYLLFEEEFTLKQIQVFLEEDCNCKVAYSNLHAFCKRRFKSSSKDSVSIEPIKVKDGKPNAEDRKPIDIFANLKS